MKQFEYRWIEIEGTCYSSTNTIKSLNHLGKEGWQLVGKLHESSNLSMGFGGLFIREAMKKKLKIYLDNPE